MSATEASVVGAHANQVVDGIRRVRIDDVRGHVEAFGGELDERVQLVAHGASVGEALEMDDEHFGEGPEVKLLGRPLVLLAPGAEPRIVRSQPLRRRKHFEALLELQNLLLGRESLLERRVLLQVVCCNAIETLLFDGRLKFARDEALRCSFEMIKRAQLH